MSLFCAWQINGMLIDMSGFSNLDRHSRSNYHSLEMNTEECSHL
jgi:hypothetical protein